MDNCKFKLSIDGHFQSFSSEQELNDFLRVNRKSLVTALLTDKVVFSKELDKQETVVSAVRNMSDTIDFKEDVHDLSVNRGPMNGVKLTPVTKFIYESIGETGNKLVPGFKLDEWKAQERDRLSKFIKDDGTPKYTPEDITRIIKSTVERWETQSYIGTSFHKVAEGFFNGTIETPNDVFEKVPELKGNSFAARQHLAKLQTFKEFLTKRHGDEAVFLTEVKLFDKDTKVGGISDLLVIDKTGDIHIYDYKTSTSRASEWTKIKKDTIAYQLGFYRQILRRAEYNIGSINYVPVQLLDMDVESKSIGNLEVEPTVPILIPDSSPTGRNINMLMPFDFSSKLKEVTSNKEINHFLKESFNYDVTTPENIPAESIDSFIAKLQLTENGRQYMFRDEMNNRQWRYIDAKRGPEFVRTSVERYLKELEQYNRFLPARFHSFIMHAKEVTTKNEKVDYLSWSNNKNVDTANKVERLLSKYIDDPNWNAIQSDALNDLGILAFENSVTNEVDFMAITASSLDAQPVTNGKKGLLRGKTLLGNFMQDHKARTLPGIKYDLTNKDIEFLKVYAFIKNNEGIFKKKKIGNIFAVNMYNNNIIPNIAMQTVDAIDRQWELLMKNVPSTLSIKDKTWKPVFTNFADAFAAHIGGLLERNDFQASRAREIRKEYNTLIDATDQEEKYESLVKMQQFIDQSVDYKVENAIVSQKDLALASLLVNRAILQIKDIPTQIEPDLKKQSIIVDENASHTNPNKITHLAYSKMFDLVSAGMNDTAQVFNKFKREISEPLNQDLYKGTSSTFKTKILGYNLDSFSNLFEVENGKRTMRFKDPDTAPGLKDVERQYIRKYMDTLAGIRVEKMAARDGKVATDMDKQLFLGTPEARNIPLMRASMLSAFVGKNYKDFFKDYARRVLNPANIYDEDDESKRALANQSNITNFFDIFDLNEDKRQEKLQTSTPEQFESDLEAILDVYYLSHAKQKELGKMMPQINALKTMMALNEHYFFNESETTLEAMRNFISTVALENRIVAGESKQAAIIADSIQQATSMAVMAMKPAGFITEISTGMFANIVRIAANRYDDKLFGAKDFAQAWSVVMRDNVKGTNIGYDNVVLCDELNDMFRLAERDLKQLAYKQQTTASGLTNFRSKHMYMFNNIPSYMNRMVIFVAQAIRDGVLEVNGAGGISHTSALQVKNGKLVYNEKLDKRYKEYLANPDLDEKSWTKSWKESRALYFGAKEDLSTQPEGLKADGSLAMPYTNRERDSMKEFADELHGNYDPENKDAFSKTAWGKILNQFKGGWVSAKLNRWYTATTSEGKKGRFEVEWTEDGEPVRVWKGRVTEGILQTLVAVASEIRNRRTPLIWDELDTVRKENLTIMFADLALFGLLTYLLGLTGWLTQGTKEEDPLTYQSARALNNAVQDSWIGNTLAAYTGDKNPVAMFSWGSGVINNSWGMLTGQANAGTHLMNQVGIFRSLNGLVGDNNPDNN